MPLITKGQLKIVVQSLKKAMSFKADKDEVNALLKFKADKTDLDSKADKTDLDSKADKTDLGNKVDRIHPVCTGAFSLNRPVSSTVGICSFAHNSTASGNYSHAEGWGTVASGNYSHAEGWSTTASGEYSHAEGNGTVASGNYSHAEGINTVASDYCSHAEGGSTVASGDYSHAEGWGTKTQGKSQHVQGECNILDTASSSASRGKYAHIVGNGLSTTNRSNAHTLDWDGNAWYQGDVYVGSTSGTNRDEGSKKLATEEYVDELVTSIDIPDAVINPSTASVGQTLTVKTIDDSGKPTEWESIDFPNSGVYYVATDPENGLVADPNADNTLAMQNLIQKVHDNGGGVIWLPIGTYGFDINSENRIKVNDDLYMCLQAMSGVSIMGESLTETVIRVYGTNSDTSWISNPVTKTFGINPAEDNEFLHGFTYQNFTVDMSDSDMAVDSDGNIIYSSFAKAFCMKALRNCIFRDLRILESPATGFGIDMLDNVVIDSLYLYKCGKRWQYGNQGGAGIGIGTGRWEQENFIIRNCVCAGCGHFGIFLEDQGIFNNMERNFTMGKIVANNIVRNGNHYGIGIRGGQNVVVTGNNIYRNNGGIYLDYGAQRITISNNAIAESTEAGLIFGIEDAGFGDYACEEIAVFGNSFIDNKIGMYTIREPINSKIENNIFIENENDTLVEIPINESKIKQGVYINDAGEEATHAPSWLYDEFIDLDTTHVTWTPIGKADGTYKNPRIAVYGENKEFLCRMNDDYQPDNLRTDIEAKLTSIQESRPYHYIKFGDNCNGDILTSLRLYNKIAEEESTDTQDKFMLTDEVTGIKYKLSISDGKLTMTEVTA